MVTREIQINVDSYYRNKDNFLKTIKKLRGLGGITDVESITEASSTCYIVTRWLSISGQDYNFIDVLSTITKAGYAVLDEKEVSSERCEHNNSRAASPEDLAQLIFRREK